MNKTTEALKMAIQFASIISETYATGGEAEKVLNACKEALAQPQPKLFLDLSNSNGNHPVQQEPVAWMYKRDDGVAHLSFTREEPAPQFKRIPLYTNE